MQLLLVAVGKLRPALREVCDDYLRRLGRFMPIEEREVKEAGRATTGPLQREAEGKRLLAAGRLSAVKWCCSMSMACAGRAKSSPRSWRRGDSMPGIAR